MTRNPDGTPRELHDALASHADDYAVVRELHAVPPHAVYEVRLEGRRGVCKLARGPEADPATEARVVAHVARETTVPAPEVLAVGDDHFVAAWHDGLPEDPTLTERRARAMGAGLATLHDETTFDAYGQFGGPEVADASTSDEIELTLDSRESWPATLRALLSDCRAFLEPYGYAAVADEVSAFLREHPAALEGAGAPVLVHGNYLLEHVGVADERDPTPGTAGGAVTCVIDFEHALAGAGEFDYWATVLPTFWSSNHPEADGLESAFRGSYESVRPLPEGFDRRAPVYRAVLGVTYLRSLYLQENWESRAEADRRADALAGRIRETLAELEGALE